MRFPKIVSLLGILLLVTGCLRSLHPLFTENDLFFDPALLGTWVDKDENTWIFQSGDESTYELIHHQQKYGDPAKAEHGESTEFEAYLLRLGEFQFLDIYPKEPQIKNDFYKAHLIPAHSFLRFWLDKEGLRLAMFDHDWLKDMITKEDVKIGHENLDGRIILTASTQELQDLVLTYAENPKAFPNPGRLHRQK